MKNKKNIVIKLGTTSIIQDNMLDIQFIESLAKCIKTLHENATNEMQTAYNVICKLGNLNM